MVESAAEANEELMNKYLEGGDLSIEDIKAGLRLRTIASEIVPMLCGSAFKNKGVQAMLDAVIEYMPAPTDIPPVTGELENGKQGERRAADDEPFAGLAFKIMTDPYVGQLIFFRVYSGVVNSGDTVYNPIKGRKERLGRILQMHANQREEIKEVRAGDIAAAVGLKEATTGDTLCDPDHVITLEKMIFPEPVIHVAVEPKTKADQEKMGIALQPPGAGGPVVPRAHRRGVGPDDHLRHGRAAPGDHRRPDEARVRRRGQRRRAAGGLPRGDPQAGAGRGQVHQAVGRPRPVRPRLAQDGAERAGKGFEFVDAIKGGTVPREFIPAVEKGLRETLPDGVLAGYPVVDVKVTLFDGSSHDVDSNENAFKMAASMAFKDGMRQAHPVLLEPMMAVEVETPEDFMGNVVGDLSSRRGMIQGMEEMPTGKVIKAEVPLAEMFGYSTTLRSLSQGRATYTMEFKHYTEAPKNVAEAVINKKS